MLNFWFFIAFKLEFTLGPCCMAESNLWNSIVLVIHTVTKYFLDTFRVIGALYLKSGCEQIMNVSLNCWFCCAGHLTSAEEPV